MVPVLGRVASGMRQVARAELGGVKENFYAVVTGSKHMCVCRRVQGMRCVCGRGLKLLLYRGYYLV